MNMNINKRARKFEIYMDNSKSIETPPEEQRVSCLKSDEIENTTKTQGENSKHRPNISKWFLVPVIATFIWLFIGITTIMGYRMYWNSPIHPSFALFGIVAFAVIVAFSIVLTLEHVTGQNLSFKVGGLEFTGTSGPVILWVLVFSTIMISFIAAGAKDLVQSDAPPNPPAHHLIK